MGKAEASVEDYLKAQVKLRRGETRKVKWIGRRGGPDRLVLLPLRKQHPFIEVKAPGEEVDWNSPQGREIEFLRKCGFIVLVVSSKDEVDTLMKWLEEDR